MSKQNQSDWSERLYFIGTSFYFSAWAFNFLKAMFDWTLTHWIVRHCRRVARRLIIKKKQRFLQLWTCFIRTFVIVVSRVFSPARPLAFTFNSFLPSFSSFLVAPLHFHKTLGKIPYHPFPGCASLSFISDDAYGSSTTATLRPTDGWYTTKTCQNRQCL